MAFVAEVSRDVSVSAEVIFDRLADYGSWSAYMPVSFRPVSKGSTLRAGDSLRMRIAGAPARIHVTVVDRAREITWTGGVRGVLYAKHRFLFESKGEGAARVRSVETWSGVLATLLRPILKRKAEEVGGEQVDALVRAASKDV